MYRSGRVKNFKFLLQLNDLKVLQYNYDSKGAIYIHVYEWKY